MDIRYSYRVWSVAILTFSKTHKVVACRPCGHKAQIRSMWFSLGLGWWGIPFGLILTPIQVIRNVIAMLRADRLGPSKELVQSAAVELGFIKAQQAAAQLDQTQTSR